MDQNYVLPIAGAVAVWLWILALIVLFGPAAA